MQTDFKLGMVVDDIDGDGNDDSTKDYIWPICLPKNDNEFTSKRGMLAGWLDTPPIQQTASNLLGGITTGEGVLRSNFISRVTGQEMQKKCEDPQYQKNGKGAVDTFYPPGVVCSVDPSFGMQQQHTSQNGWEIASKICDHQILVNYQNQDSNTNFCKVKFVQD